MNTPVVLCDPAFPVPHPVTAIRQTMRTCRVGGYAFGHEALVLDLFLELREYRRE